MGVGLSVYTVAQLARITVPTLGEAPVGWGLREAYDRQIGELARRAVAKAEI